MPGPHPVGWRWAPVADRPYDTERRLGPGHVAVLGRDSRNCSTYPSRGYNLGNRAWWPGHSVRTHVTAECHVAGATFPCYAYPKAGAGSAPKSGGCFDPWPESRKVCQPYSGNPSGRRDADRCGCHSVASCRGGGGGKHRRRGQLIRGLVRRRSRLGAELLRTTPSLN